MKVWRGPRNKKVTPEIKVQMQELRDEGWTWKRIAEKFDLCSSTVRYHLAPGAMEKTKRRATKAMRKKFFNMTDEEKRKRREYQRDYMRTRYQNDPEFRQRMLWYIKNYRERVNRVRGLH